MRINFHIERLTVEGKSRADGLRIGDALRSRLADLAAGGGLSQPSSLNIAHLDAGELARGANAAQTGDHLAGRIVQQLKGSPHG